MSTFPREAPGRWPLIAVAVAAGSVVGAVWMQLNNSRTLVSWHGFLHTAIANRFPGPFAAPENPFFAGERLPYYWFHHYVASFIARASGTDIIHALQVITAAGLGLLWIGALMVGVRHLGSWKAGLLVAFLVLGGVNPLGPVIAGAKHVVQGKELFDTVPQDSVETVFTTEQVSGTLMTQPLLGALYVTADWRRGQNIPFYLDNSSRGLALALLLPLVLLFLQRATPLGIAATTLVAASIAALSPLVGLGVVGSLGGGVVAVALFDRLRSRAGSAAMLRSALWPAGAAVAGVVLAAPTYYHLFLAGGSAMEVPSSGAIIIKTLALALNVVVLLPLALLCAARTTGLIGDRLRMLVMTACALLMVVPLIFLPDDTEHNLANAAQVLLAIPAAAWVVQQNARRAYLGVIAICLPMSAASLVSFMGRPSLAIAFNDGTMHRTTDPSLEALYQWIRANTPLEAVFVADPTTPVRLSGNVAELPAFTGRTLFVDEASYLTTPHADFARRINLATRLVAGETLTTEDALYLNTLRRPIYLVIARPGNAVGAEPSTHGPAVFRDGPVAVFEITTSRASAPAGGY